MAAPLKGLNIKKLKTSLRHGYKAYRQRLSKGQKRIYDTSILYNLLSLPEYKANHVIFLYMSKAEEVDTYRLIERCWQDGKQVVVPRCVPNTRDMDFYLLTDFDQLEKATFGLMEPKVAVCPLWTDYSQGLCIVPGLSFDAKGYRLGYGMGYYDRFLSSFAGNTVGICYASCVQYNLPHGYFDRPVEVLVTENFIRRIQPTGKEESQ